MENSNVDKIKSIQPNAIVFDLTNGDKYNLKKLAFKTALSTNIDTDVIIIQQSVSDFITPNEMGEIS